MCKEDLKKNNIAADRFFSLITANSLILLCHEELLTGGKNIDSVNILQYW